STVSPAATRRIAEKLQRRGVAMLDAPVSGGQDGAEKGTLSVMVGGPAPVLERCRHVLQIVGKTIVHVGDTGAGQVAKACNQIVIGVTIQAVAEALGLAKALGVHPARVRAALLGGSAHSSVLDLKGQRMLDAHYDPGFRVRLHRKDLGIALDAGKAAGVPLLTTALVDQLLAILSARGADDLDNAALALLVDEWSR
ncbi:MAG: NAD(P)-dependent oxidoreductase, partial [Egibacteraceae bacterium]